MTFRNDLIFLPSWDPKKIFLIIRLTILFIFKLFFKMYVFGIFMCYFLVFLRINSPGLWPMACQILDFLPFFTASLPPSLLCSILPFFRCFWDLSGAYCGGRQGAIPSDVPSPSDGRRTCQPRLEIALVFDPIFLPFWVDLGFQDGSKINRNPSKINFKIALDLQLVFETTF